MASCAKAPHVQGHKEWAVEWIASDTQPSQGQEARDTSFYAATLDPAGPQSAWLAQEADFPSFEAQRLETEIFRLTNELRRLNKRSPLRVNPQLSQVSRSHSQEMARLGYLSHNSPTPGRKTPEDRLALAGLGFRVSAENIAYEPCLAHFWSDGRREFYTWGQVAANAVRHWANSSGHRENLLRHDVRELGVGAAMGMRDGRPYVYLTQSFRAP